MENKRGAYSAAEKYPKQLTIPEMPDISQKIIKIKTHYECQYYLPCGVCDKSGEKCDMAIKALQEEVENDYGRRNQAECDEGR